MSAEVDVRWTLAGPGGRLEHRATVGASGIYLDLGVDGTRTQRIDVPRGQLVPSLVRTLKIRPVKDAHPVALPFAAGRIDDLLGDDQALRDQVLEEIGARTAWSIVVDAWRLAGVNGPDGVLLAHDDRLAPMTNTAFYRLLCRYFATY